MRRVHLLALVLAGCSAVPPAPPPAAPAPTAAPAAAAPSASTSASAPASPAAPAWVVDEDGKGTPLSADLDAPNVPDAACFAARVYRGTIGKERVTIAIATNGARLSGRVHYDLPGPGIELSGEIKGGSFSLVEKGAGRFEGTCEAKTGRLTGSYALSGKKTAFALAPRPGGETALHVVHERIRGTSPVPSYCARLGKTTETQTVAEGICLPSDPAALAALQEAYGAGLCTFELRAPRVFGFENPGVERAANVALSHDGAEYASPSVLASVKRCPAGGEVKAGGGFSIVHNASEVLSVFLSGYINEANAAHGAMFGPDPVVVDLRSGKRLAIGDVVSDEAAFRKAILACDPGNYEDLEWGEKDSLRKAPRWAIVPGGIAVVVGPVAPIKNGLQGRGPIASFASLVKRRLLRADSTIARLWAGVTPAPDDAPFCQAMMGDGEILTVRRGAPSP
ncbi:Hypothetical protein A7982_04644 [Minicystis rosea]|nr:Hypothetical protein A7982_04644 [Minicystis rosea]